jgi:hypothetical protein
MIVENLRQKLADWRFDRERQTLTVGSPDGWAVDVAAECSDEIGCRLWEVTVRRTDEKSLGELKARAEKAAARVQGLLEPLTLVELDATRQTAQLRSAHPARQGDELHYYEAAMQANGQAAFRRFKASHLTGRREQIPFNLTHEAVASLVGALAR